MSKHDEHPVKEHHQAEHLMKLFQEVANHNPDAEEDEDETTEIDEKEMDHQDEQINSSNYVELDMLNLPPRREVHQKSKVRFYFSFTNPFTRLLFVVLLIVATLGLLLYFDFIQDPFSIFYFVRLHHIITIEYSMVIQKMI